MSKEKSMKKEKPTLIVEMETKNPRIRRFRIQGHKNLTVGTIIKDRQIPRLLDQHPDDELLEVYDKQVSPLARGRWDCTVKYRTKTDKKKGKTMEVAKNMKFEQIAPDRDLLEIAKEILSQNRLILEHTILTSQYGVIKTDDLPEPPEPPENKTL